MTFRTSGGTPSSGNCAAAARTAPSWSCWKEGCPERFMSRISCTTTSLRTVAWWSRVLISASVVFPVLLVLSSTRTTPPRLSPARGSCRAAASSSGFSASSPLFSSCLPPARAACASCACSCCSRSSQHSGKVRALPRPRWRAQLQRGALAAVSCFHGHADEGGHAGAGADHFHDGDLVGVQPFPREIRPHVVAEAQGRQLGSGQVFEAVRAEGHFAVFALCAGPGALGGRRSLSRYVHGPVVSQVVVASEVRSGAASRWARRGLPPQGFSLGWIRVRQWILLPVSAPSRCG